jgi:hypothetical protein
MVHQELKMNGKNRQVVDFSQMISEQYAQLTKSEKRSRIIFVKTRRISFYGSS